MNALSIEVTIDSVAQRETVKLVNGNYDANTNPASRATNIKYSCCCCCLGAN